MKKTKKNIYKMLSVFSVFLFVMVACDDLLFFVEKAKSAINNNDKNGHGIDIMSDVKIIAKRQYANKGLKYITFKEESNLVEIREGAFENNKIYSIEVPQSVHMIGRDAFRNNNINSLILGANLRLIASGAFEGNKIRKISLPDSLSYRIDSHAFAGNEIEEIVLGKNVPDIMDVFVGNPVKIVKVRSQQAANRALVFLNKAIFPHGVKIVRDEKLKTKDSEEIRKIDQQISRVNNVFNSYDKIKDGDIKDFIKNKINTLNDDLNKRDNKEQTTQNNQGQGQDGSSGKQLPSGEQVGQSSSSSQPSSSQEQGQDGSNGEQLPSVGQVERPGSSSHQGQGQDGSSGEQLPSGEQVGQSGSSSQPSSSQGQGQGGSSREQLPSVGQVEQSSSSSQSSSSQGQDQDGSNGEQLPSVGQVERPGSSSQGQGQDGSNGEQLPSVGQVERPGSSSQGQGQDGSSGEQLPSGEQVGQSSSSGQPSSSAAVENKPPLERVDELVTIESISIKNKKKRYGIGQKIVFLVRFTHIINDPASYQPVLKLLIGSNKTYDATYEGRDSDGKTLRFGYTVNLSGVGLHVRTLRIVKNPISFRNSNSFSLSNPDGKRVDVSYPLKTYTDIVYTARPVINAISIVDEREDKSNSYKTGDKIKIKVVFSEKVKKMHKRLFLYIRVGDKGKGARYVSGNETDTFIFEYVPQIKDTGRICLYESFIAHTIVGLIPIRMKHAITNLVGNKGRHSGRTAQCLSTSVVSDNEKAKITAISFLTVGPYRYFWTNRVRDRDASRSDSQVKIKVTFSKPVKVTHTPVLKLRIGGKTKKAYHRTDSRYLKNNEMRDLKNNEILFSYDIQLDDNDPNGINIPRNALALQAHLATPNNEPTIKDLAGRNVEIGNKRIKGGKTQRVDVGPKVQELTISSTPNSEQGYTVGEKIKLKVRFSENVSFKGKPYLKLDIGGTERRTNQISQHDQRTLIFAYTLQQNDRDNNGIALKGERDSVLDTFLIYPIHFPAGSFIRDKDDTQDNLKHNSLTFEDIKGDSKLFENKQKRILTFPEHKIKTQTISN